MLSIIKSSTIIFSFILVLSLHGMKEKLIEGSEPVCAEECKKTIYEVNDILSLQHLHMLLKNHLVYLTKAKDLKPEYKSDEEPFTDFVLTLAKGTFVQTSDTESISCAGTLAPQCGYAFLEKDSFLNPEDVCHPAILSHLPFTIRTQIRAAKEAILKERGIKDWAALDKFKKLEVGIEAFNRTRPTLLPACWKRAKLIEEHEKIVINRLRFLTIKKQFKDSSGVTFDKTTGKTVFTDMIFNDTTRTWMDKEGKTGECPMQ